VPTGTFFQPTQQLVGLGVGGTTNRRVSAKLVTHSGPSWVSKNQAAIIIAELGTALTGRLAIRHTGNR